MKINKRDAELFMQEMINSGKNEAEVCPKTLHEILMQHHSVYLKYITIRDNS